MGNNGGCDEDENAEVRPVIARLRREVNTTNDFIMSLRKCKVFLALFDDMVRKRLPNKSN